MKTRFDTSTHSWEKKTLRTRWKLTTWVLQCAIYKLFLSTMIYKCNSRKKSQHSWGPSSQTAKRWKQSRSFLSETYGSDQEECVSVQNSNKPNEFPRSAGGVFVLFSEREDSNSCANLYSSDRFENGAPTLKWRERGVTQYAPPCRRD